MKKLPRWFQIYSTRPIPSSFRFRKNPYLNEDEQKRLIEQGVDFYRDEKNGTGCPAVENDSVRQMFMSKGQIQKDGSIEWQCLNWKVQVNWIAKYGVNGKIVEGKNYDPEEHHEAL